MAAGVTILHKRKAGAFVGGDLAAGEFGVDVTNSDLYFSIDGAAVVQLDVSAIGAGGYSTSAELIADLSDETGTGNLVFSTSPTLVTPTLGAALASSINKLIITTPATSATLTIADGASLVTGGAFPMTLNASASTNVTLPTSGTLANEAYVDAAVAGLLDYKGGYAADTNTPDLDVSPSGILTGDSYTVTAAGSFFSEVVEAGDFLIAEQDSPTLASHWTIVQRNADGFATTANGLDQFGATTSAELAGVISDETGSGALVFGTGPTLDAPIFSTISNTGLLTLPTSTDTLVGRDTTDTLTNKTMSAASNTIDGGTI